MSPQSDERPEFDHRQPFPILTNMNATSNNQQTNRPRGERSPISPGEPNNPVAQSMPPKQTSRICRKCGQSFVGKYVRALGGAYHLDCFKCRVAMPTQFSNLTQKTYMHSY